ncbi:Holin of 3TMs, for gene-transfer release [uncultured Caudovirales phage]|uniref:Holin of 3TMs, for gene-transfer release n=1 Tax=uncultured Caudovirales phage TaxID=2100421 RepID=A0A6J5TA97_9CAUD|nr:Holin of 3TMs, for gene-transfer release [uncultured Caudovirales phage]
MADLTGLGAISDLAGSVINKIWPDKSEEEKQQLAAAVMVVQGQLDINKVEAANPSVFVSGARPFIMWVCGFGCAWNWIGLPVACFIFAALGKPITLAPANLSEMMPLLLGMLGLGGFRTIEKLNGVARS